MVSDMKIVLWGKKLHTDTYSYIQYGYYRAADYLGYKVEWYGDEDDVSEVDELCPTIATLLDLIPSVLEYKAAKASGKWMAIEFISRIVQNILIVGIMPLLGLKNTITHCGNNTENWLPELATEAWTFLSCKPL